MDGVDSTANANAIVANLKDKTEGALNSRGLSGASHESQQLLAHQMTSAMASNRAFDRAQKFET